MPSKARFRPPPVEITPEIKWVLRRAFGRVTGEKESELDPAFDPALDPILAVRQARLLGLSCRIAHRTAIDDLELELSHESAADLKSDQQRAVARSLLHQRLYEIVIEKAEKAGISFAVLKGMALVASGVTAPGSRPFGDLDILVSDGEADALSTAFLQGGFKTASIDDSAHHLPALRHPELGVVELHTFLPGITVEGGRVASLENLVAGGLCRSVPYHPQILLPDRRALAAHSIVHALVQHGLSPLAYPFFRMPSDVLDITIGNGASGLDRLMTKVRPLVENAISAAELDAVGELCEGLLLGSPLEELPGSKTCETLLHHGLAGALDSEYSAALKASALFRAIRRRDWRKLSERLRWSLRSGHGATSAVEYSGNSAARNRPPSTWHGFRSIVRAGRAWLMHFVRTRVMRNRLGVK